jgi:hypothetical protein
LKKNFFCIICVAIFIAFDCFYGICDSDSLIFPNPDKKICLVKAIGKSGDLLIGEELLEDQPLAKAITKQLDFSYHQSMIKLSQCARNLVSDTKGPNVLFLSQTEGGFPRQGLILKSREEAEKYPDLYFVDLVLDEERLAQGELDIYSHELGHVMMLNIMGKKIPDRRSTKQHVSMGITDYPTAFFEGWGIHFQRLAFDHIPFYQKTFLDSFDYSRSFSRVWHSSIDQSLRLNAVPENRYIYQKLLPDLDTSSLTLEELILLEHTSPVFDQTRLKNGQQMLSCEGVLATLFYRINTNRKLQNSYQDKSFYDRFLLKAIPDGITPEDIFTPMENVFLKDFFVWAKIKEGLPPKSSLFIEFLQEWCRLFPEDREELIRLFIMTTVGKTVTQDLGKIYENMSYHGMIGNYQSYRNLAGQFREEASFLIQKVLKGGLEIDANLGPRLWVENKDFPIRTTLWNPENKKPLWINLNTASVYDLASFSKIDMDKAKALVEKRKELGFFTSVEQAKKYGFNMVPDPSNRP